MAIFELPDREWIRLNEVAEFWWGVCEAKRANDSASLRRIGVLFSKVSDSSIREEQIGQNVYAQDIEPILGDLTLDFERKLSDAAFDGRVHFKGKKQGTYACDHEIVPDSEFSQCRGFLSEKNEIEPCPSGVNEEAIFASAMSNDGTKWHDVLVNREDFVKWFKDEFPKLYHGDVAAAPEGHPDANIDAIQMSRTGAPGRPTGMHLVKQKLERRVNAGEIPQVPTAKQLSEDLANWYKNGPRKKHPEMPTIVAETIRKALRGELRAAVSAHGRNF